MESLLFTREDLKKLIVPLIIEQALALSIGLFDTLMVSSCGEAAVSGVSLVDSISTLLIQILSALATGGAVVCSQYIGKKMPERAKLSAGQLMGIITHPVSKSHIFQQLHGLSFNLVVDLFLSHFIIRLFLLQQFLGQHNIFQCCILRKQVK